MPKRAKGGKPAGKGENKWRFETAFSLILVLFFLFVDFLTTGRISWSLWPIGAIAFFWIAFALLNKFGRE